MTEIGVAHGPYSFVFGVEPGIRVEPYSCSSYTGVIFWDEPGNKFDVVLNPHFGPRLIFNLKNGSWNDVPFKEQTYGFLPEGVTVRRAG